MRQNKSVSIQDEHGSQLEGLLISRAKKLSVFKGGLGPYHPYTLYNNGYTTQYTGTSENVIFEATLFI